MTAAAGALVDTPTRQLAIWLDADRLTVLGTMREHLDGVFAE